MDFGLKGKTAIVCAASKGLGRGCAEALAAEGVNLVLNARTAETLSATAQTIADTYGVDVKAVPCDITTEDGRRQVLEAAQAPDILVNNAGGPPPGDFKDFSSEDWRQAVEWNMISPLALIHATVYGMMDRGFGRIVNITSYSVKAPIPVLELSNGARAGLTGAVAALSRKVAARGVTINSILPGKHDTDRLRGGLKINAEKQGVDLDVFTQQAMDTVPAKRFGTAEEFGAACAFLCSTKAAFITGQNLVLDGGEINTTL